MPKLTIPEFGIDACDFMQVVATPTLTVEQYAALKSALGLGDEFERATAVRISEPESGQRVRLRERFVLHPVTREEAEEESSAMREDDPSYPSADQIAAHLHLELSLNSALKGDVAQGDETKIEGALHWLLENQPDVEVTVAAGRSFPIDSCEPVVPFPEAVPPFSAVKGLVLVKESDEPVPGSTVYEVILQEWQDVYAASVSFKSKMSSSSDSLQKLMKYASEIAGFAIRRKVEQE